MTVGIIGNRKIGETVIWNLSGLGCKILSKEYKRRRRSMKAVIAIDSLKGSLSSMEAGYAIADGIRRVHGQDAEIVVRPLADGGEGTVEALVSGMSGVTQNVMVTGPLGIPVNCEYGIIESSHTAVIEMSGAAGITLVPDEKKIRFTRRLMELVK